MAAGGGHSPGLRGAPMCRAGEGVRVMLRRLGYPRACGAGMPDAVGRDEMGWDGMPNSQPCKAPRHCVPQNAPWPKIRAGAPQVAACPSPVVVGLSGDIWRGHQRRARGWGTACKKDASFYSQAGAVWCCVSVWDTTGSPKHPPVPLPPPISPFVLMPGTVQVRTWGLWGERSSGCCPPRSP